MKISLRYETADGSDWKETFDTIDQAAIAAKDQLGRWCGNSLYLVGEWGDCKLYQVIGATLKELEDKMKEMTSSEEWSR